MDVMSFPGAARPGYARRLCAEANFVMVRGKEWYCQRYLLDKVCRIKVGR